MPTILIKNFRKEKSHKTAKPHFRSSRQNVRHGDTLLYDLVFMTFRVHVHSEVDPRWQIPYGKCQKAKYVYILKTNPNANGICRLLLPRNNPNPQCLREQHWTW